MWSVDSDGKRKMNRHVYLVVEPIEIIASDLAMTLQEYNPAATVLIALTLQAAIILLENQTVMQLAIVHTDPIGFADTALAQALGRLGAQVVFTGDAAERKSGGRLVLQRPFSAQSTTAFLQLTEGLQDV